MYKSDGTFSYFSKPFSGRKVDMERLANALLVVSVRCIGICAFESGSHMLLKSRYIFAFGSPQEIRYFLRDLFDLYKSLKFSIFAKKRSFIVYRKIRLHKKHSWMQYLLFYINKLSLLINMAAYFLSVIIDTFNMVIYYSYKKITRFALPRYIESIRKRISIFRNTTLIGY